MNKYLKMRTWDALWQLSKKRIDYLLELLRLDYIENLFDFAKEHHLKVRQKIIKTIFRFNKIIFFEKNLAWPCELAGWILVNGFSPHEIGKPFYANFGFISLKISFLGDPPLETAKNSWRHQRKSRGFCILCTLKGFTLPRAANSECHCLVNFKTNIFELKEERQIHLFAPTLKHILLLEWASVTCA